jgi:hypothetical protein
MNPCHYEEPDTRAAMAQNEDSTWYSLCNCGTLACPSGTYDEALNALVTHRQVAP